MLLNKIYIEKYKAGFLVGTEILFHLK